MRFAVVGAGVAGLVAARQLAHAGHDVTVYERWPGLGGQAATIDVGDGHRVERYYHHWFQSDRHILDLCRDLGIADDIEWHESSMGVFVDGRTLPFTGPLDLLRFTPLSPLERLRMGAAVVRLQRSRRPVSSYEHRTARSWIEAEMGNRAYEAFWGPLLRGKFGSRADDISMAWLWGKLNTRRKLKGKDARRERLGYPARSFEPLFEALVADIRRLGGHVRIDAPIKRVDREGDGFRLVLGRVGSYRRGLDPEDYEASEDEYHCDGVLATVPSDIFAGIARHLVDADYVAALGKIQYHTAVCLLLELDRPFSPFYWTNIADASLPFVGLVEHTNLVPPGRYDGRRFLYVANYVEHDDPLARLDADQLLMQYAAGLRAVNPAFNESWVLSRWRFVEPAGQPIVDLGYHERITPMRTGIPGLVLANTTQIYPEDRGTNYAVREGRKAATVLMESVSP